MRKRLKRKARPKSSRVSSPLPFTCSPATGDLGLRILPRGGSAAGQGLCCCPRTCSTASGNVMGLRAKLSGGTTRQHLFVDAGLDALQHTRHGDEQRGLQRCHVIRDLLRVALPGPVVRTSNHTQPVLSPHGCSETTAAAEVRRSCCGARLQRRELLGWNLLRQLKHMGLADRESLVQPREQHAPGSSRCGRRRTRQTLPRCGRRCVPAAGTTACCRPWTPVRPTAK